MLIAEEARRGRLRDLVSTALAAHRGKLMDVSAVAGSRILRQGVLLVAMAVAARVLSKELLGVWSLIYIVVQFGVLLSDAGISTFVVRERKLTDRLYSTALYGCVVLSIIVAAATAAVIIPVSALLGYPGYTMFFVAAAVSIVPLGINAVLQARLRRDRRFGVIFATDLLANGITLVGMISMLLSGAQLWSFIVPTIVGSTIGCIACACLTGLPRLTWNRRSVKRIADYSMGLVGFSSVYYWARNADHLLIGRYLGAAPLGIYSIGYKIMMLPLSQINATAATVALPYLSPHQDDQRVLRQTMRRLLAVIGALTTGPMIFVWLQRYFLVELFLGPGWERVGDLLLVLAPVAVFQAFVNPIGLCFQVSGQTRLFFVIGLFQTSALLTGFVIGVCLGSIDDVVMAYAIAMLLASPVGVHAGLRTIGGDVRQWIAWCSPYFICLAVCWLVHQVLTSGAGPLAALTTDLLIASVGGIAAGWVAIRAAWARVDDRASREASELQPS